MTQPLLLCATDLEDESPADLAAATCRALGARLLLVHAVDPETPESAPPDSVAPAIEGLSKRLEERRARARERLDALKARLAGGCDIETELVPGVTPADAILRAAQSRKPALIVLGRRHREGGILAKTVDQVCRRALCPVFVTPTGASLTFEGARWLVGADLSTHSLRAIRATKALAQNAGAVKIVQIVEPMGSDTKDYADRSPQDILRAQGLREDERRLKELAEAEMPEAEVAQVRSLDRTHEALEEVAEEWNASAIVVGTHGRSGLARLFIGSTAEHLLRTAKRPVLVVRDAPHAPAPLFAPVVPAPEAIGPNRIVVAIDFSEPARRALEMARDIARSVDAKVSVVHVFDDPGDIRHGIVGRGLDAPRASALPEGAKSQLEGAIESQVAEVFGDAAADVARVLLVGRPVEEICAHAKSLRADLLVVGTTGRSGVERLLLGSVAEKVIREAGVPVLTVP